MPQKSILIVMNAQEKGWLRDGKSDMAVALKGFKEAISARGNVKVEITSLDLLRFTVVAGEVRIFDTHNDCDIKEFDSIFFKNVAHYWDFARAIVNYMHAHGKSTLEPIDEATPDYGKLSQMVLFGMNDVAVPETYAAWHLDDVVTMLREHKVPFPWIIKSIAGIMGKDNYLITSDEALQQIDGKGKQFVGQRYIPNDSDYRVLFFGTSQEPLIFKKVAQSGTHLNNTSRGGQSFMTTPTELGEAPFAMAKKAAALTKRRFAGVDVMQNSETGDWVVLEVNANPALVTGAFTDKKIELFEQLLQEVI
jgi:glutathione synthase/RimK-type ligase-like ATP-grasp enzyme